MTQTTVGLNMGLTVDGDSIGHLTTIVVWGSRMWDWSQRVTQEGIAITLRYGTLHWGLS